MNNCERLLRRYAPRNDKRGRLGMTTSRYCERLLRRYAPRNDTKRRVQNDTKRRAQNDRLPLL